jgi:REP element-mobilizing transposase RayT
VIAHAVADEPLFYDNVDRKRYLGLLQQVTERFDWAVPTFVLMSNHVHLLVEAMTESLSRGLWWLHSNYAARLLARHPPRRGHVFESRPRTLPIRNEAYLFAVLRYIASNPVGAGICPTPDAYRWGAHRAIAGLAPPMPVVAEAEVLGLFDTDVRRARERYRAFVTGAEPPEHAEIKCWAERPRPDRPPLAELLASRSTDSIRAAHLEWGYSLRSIASALGMSHTTVARRIARP